MISRALTLALCGSIAAHGALLSGWAYFDKEDVKAVQHKSHKISLGMQAASKGATSQTEIKPLEVIKPKQDKPKKTQPTKKQKPSQQPLLKKKPKEKLTPPKPTAPQKTESQKGLKGIDGSKSKTITTEETGKAQEIGAQNLFASYDSHVLKHLGKFKKYPSKLRQRRLESTVEVEFSIDRSGRLITSKVLSNKVHRHFKKSAIRQLHRAQPFPEPPSEANWGQRYYRVSVNYSVQQI